MYFKSAACEMQIKVYFCINCHMLIYTLQQDIFFTTKQEEILPFLFKLDFIQPSFHCENGM